MRRFLTLVCLLCLALPAGISISGCYRNPSANYCNGLGYGMKVTDVDTITLSPQTTGVSLAFGQTQQLGTPSATNCKGDSAYVESYTYGTTNNQLVDVSPSGNLCAGTWNRNSGGGIPNYTTCTAPDPLPSTGNLPYGTAYVSASADSVSSNPVSVYVHAKVTSISLVGPSSCLSQGTLWSTPLDVQACYAGSSNQQYELCAPASVVSSGDYACSAGAPSGATIPDCTSSIGTLSYSVSNSTIASINSETNQITAEMPGTTSISASVAGSESSAGYFSTCPPASITVTLNGESGPSEPVTVNEGATATMVTTILDTNGKTISGLSLDYQSTDPLDISASSTGAITATYPGQASIYAICQPPSCNPAPIDYIGLFGTGLSVTSNSVNIVTNGTASEYAWFGAPGQSQYFVPIELLTGTVGSGVKLPYVPNSMVMDRLGTNLYFGSTQELMVYSVSSNALSSTSTSVPGVVLAVSPNNAVVVVSDQVRGYIYLYNTASSSATAYSGMGNAAAWTPDSKTLYITDSAALGGNHTDTLYVYNTNSGWSSYPLATSSGSKGAQNLAIAIPGVGAFLSGEPTVAHTWCPSGTVGSTSSMLFYPQGTDTENSVAATTDVLAATVDGEHVLGAATTGTSTTGENITLSDIGVTLPESLEAGYNCLPTDMTTNPLAIGDTLSPMVLTTTLAQKTITASAAAVNQVVTSPSSSLAFVTYSPIATGAATGVSLPYYLPSTGTVGTVPLTGTAITAPVAGAFSPDDALFFLSTAGDNMVHYISVPDVTSAPASADTQQITPNLQGCTPVADGGTDSGCTLSTPQTYVPATVITVKPRSTT